MTQLYNDRVRELMGAARTGGSTTETIRATEDLQSVTEVANANTQRLLQAHGQLLNRIERNTRHLDKVNTLPVAIAAALATRRTTQRPRERDVRGRFVATSGRVTATASAAVDEAFTNAASSVSRELTRGRVRATVSRNVSATGRVLATTMSKSVGELVQSTSSSMMQTLRRGLMNVSALAGLRRMAQRGLGTLGGLFAPTTGASADRTLLFLADQQRLLKKIERNTRGGANDNGGGWGDAVSDALDGLGDGGGDEGDRKKKGRSQRNQRNTRGGRRGRLGRGVGRLGAGALAGAGAYNQFGGLMGLPPVSSLTEDLEKFGKPVYDYLKNTTTNEMFADGFAALGLGSASGTVAGAGRAGRRMPGATGAPTAGGRTRAQDVALQLRANGGVQGNGVGVTNGRVTLENTPATTATIGTLRNTTTQIRDALTTQSDSIHGATGAITKSLDKQIGVFEKLRQALGLGAAAGGGLLGGSTPAGMGGGTGGVPGAAGLPGPAGGAAGSTYASQTPGNSAAAAGLGLPGEYTGARAPISGREYTSVDGTDARAELMNEMMGAGLTKKEAAARVGNMAVESRYGGVEFNPAASGDNGSAEGLMQWRHDRRANLKKWAATQNPPLDPSTRQAQARFAVEESREGSPYADPQSVQAQKWMRANPDASVEDMTAKFMWQAERPSTAAGNASVGERQAAARGALTLPDGRVVQPGGTDGSVPTSRVTENQGRLAAVRKLAIEDDLKQKLQFAAEKAGIDEVSVYSGGQYAKGQGPHKGGYRHDHGKAADVKLRVRDPETGKLRNLNVNNPADLEKIKAYTTNAVYAGVTGIGQGQGYMGPESMHFGGGTPGVWGAGGVGATAPQWLRDTYAAAQAGKQQGAEQFNKWKTQAAEASRVAAVAPPGLAGITSGAQTSQQLERDYQAEQAMVAQANAGGTQPINPTGRVNGSVMNGAVLGPTATGVRRGRRGEHADRLGDAGNGRAQKIKEQMYGPTFGKLGGQQTRTSRATNKRLGQQDREWAEYERAEKGIVRPPQPVEPPASAAPVAGAGRAGRRMPGATGVPTAGGRTRAPMPTPSTGATTLNDIPNLGELSMTMANSNMMA